MAGFDILDDTDENGDPNPSLHDERMAGLYSAHIDTLFLTNAGYGVGNRDDGSFDVFDISYTTGQSYAVDPGGVWAVDSFYKIPGATIATTYASGDPYWGLVTANPAVPGIIITHGTPGTAPKPPAIPGGHIPLYLIFADSTSGSNTRVVDLRMFLSDPPHPAEEIYARANYR